MEELKRYFSEHRWQAKRVLGEDKMKNLQQGDRFTGTLDLVKIYK